MVIILPFILETRRIFILLVGFEDTLGFFVEMRVEQWFGYNINKGHWWF